MKKIEINALSKRYNVLLESGILSKAGALICDALNRDSGQGLKICVVTDANVNALYAGEDQALFTSLKDAGFSVFKYVFPGGEDHKNLATIEGILDYLTDNHFNRGDILLAFGGGITGDITGFAASIYMRGIKYIQIPTTLLSSVDSSVGGKTGVNLKAGKNLTGAFWQPEAVLFDPDVLKTLGYEQLLDGMGEIIKAGMITDKSLVQFILSAGSARNSESFADYMKDAAPCDASAGGKDKVPAIFGNDEALLEAIARSVDIKREIVEDDERETGRRKLLNFGHTIAHAIEKCSSYGISHGNAVAIGMCIVSKAADALGWTDEPSADMMQQITDYFQYPKNIPYTAAQLTAAALNDKKAGSNSVPIIYAQRPGFCTERKVMFEDLENFISLGL